MINIVVKRPSLSPTLKWQGFSLAPTWVKINRLKTDVGLVRAEVIGHQSIDQF